MQKQTTDITHEYHRKLQQTEKKQKKNKMITALLLVLLLLIAGLAGYWWINNNKAKSQMELDREALEGFLPGRSQEEIQQELDRIIDKSRFNVSMNPALLAKDGTIDVMIENVPANHYYMQVDLYIYLDKEQTKSALIYSSKAIKQGFYVPEGETQNLPAPGEYGGVAIFKALYPDTMEMMGETFMSVIVKVES